MRAVLFVVAMLAGCMTPTPATNAPPGTGDAPDQTPGTTGTPGGGGTSTPTPGDSGGGNASDDSDGSGDTVAPGDTAGSGDTLVGDYDISDLPTLQGVRRIDGDLTVDCATSLSVPNLQHLAVLEEVTGTLTIEACGSISDLRGLDNLAAVSRLEVRNSPSLVDLTGLGALTTAEHLIVSGNDSLMSLEGLGSITALDSLAVGSNGSLTSLNGLDDLTTVTGRVLVTFNGILADLGGLDSLASVGSLVVEENYSLVDLVALDSLTAVNGSAATVNISVSGNPVLRTIDGLHSLSSVRGRIRIAANFCLPEQERTDFETTTGYPVAIWDSNGTSIATNNCP